MLTTTQLFAASEVLTDWPEDMTYPELINAIDIDHEDVMVCELYENYPKDYIIDQIEGIKISFRNAVINMTEDLRNAIKQGSPSIIAEELAKLENQLGV